MKKLFSIHLEKPRAQRAIPGQNEHESRYNFSGRFSSFSYLGSSWGVPGTGLDKDDEKVRNQTRPNLENGVPVKTEAQLALLPRNPEMMQF